VRLGWLPSGGWTPPAHDPVEFLRRLVLPALALGLVQGAVLTRYVRSAVLDVLREDYLRTARSKGLTPGRALVRHGLRTLIKAGDPAALRSALVIDPAADNDIRAWCRLRGQEYLGSPDSHAYEVRRTG
jgi:hypothetical protein